MKVTEILDSHIDVIATLNAQGVSILYIDNELFSVREFVPSDKNIPRTVIQGVNITKLIANHLLGTMITAQQQQGLMNQITNSRVERREYSADYSWILYA